MKKRLYQDYLVNHIKYLKSKNLFFIKKLKIFTHVQNSAIIDKNFKQLLISVLKYY